jgi:hypothetical protein
LKDVLYSVGAVHYASQVTCYLLDLEHLKLHNNNCYRIAIQHCAATTGVYIEHFHAWARRNLPQGHNIAALTNQIIHEFATWREAEMFVESYKDKVDETTVNGGKSKRSEYCCYRRNVHDESLLALSQQYKLQLQKIFKLTGHSELFPAIPKSLIYKFLDGARSLEKVAVTIDEFRPFENLPDSGCFRPEVKGEIFRQQPREKNMGYKTYSRDEVTASSFQARTVKAVFSDYADGILPFVGFCEGPRFPNSDAIKKVVSSDSAKEQTLFEDTEVPTPSL